MLIRRVIIALLVCIAMLCAVLAWQTVTGTRWSGEAVAPAGAPVLSPRRAPELTASIARDTLTRAALQRAAGPLPATACLHVSQSGRVVASQRASTPLIPASTAKLFTATAVLDAYGDDARFATEVRASVDDGVVEGPLVLVGGGDPLLFTAPYQASLGPRPDFHTPLETLADRVKEKGVEVVEGAVLGDERRFDPVRAVPTWEPGYTLGGEVGPIGALMVDQGIAPVRGAPQRVPDPAVHAAAVFTDLLKARGVEVRGAPAAGAAPRDAGLVASIDSRPLGDLVAEMLIESDNTTAEVLMKQVAARAQEPGTTAEGVKATVESLQKRGVPLAALRMADGSGLDRSTRATCRELDAVLGASGPRGPVAAGLARAGETGTLRERMGASVARGRVQAKTGTLSGVSALAGWARPDASAPLSFSIVLNGADATAARALEDRVAVALVSIPPVASDAAYSPGPVPQ